MPTPPTSPQEQFQDGLSGVSSPKTSAHQSKMIEVNWLVSTINKSHVMIGSNEACGSKKQDIPNQGGEPDRVYTSLRAIVNEVASQLRKNSDEVLDPDPISYCIPEHYGGINSIEYRGTIKSIFSQSQTRAKSTLVGEEIVSFVLPLDCPIGTDSSKFYHHGQSSRMFRSTIEVVEFIMEAFIAKETSGNHSVQEQGPSTSSKGSSKRNMSSKKEEIPPSKLFKIFNAEKFPNAQLDTSRSVDYTSVENTNSETNIKCFLEESHNNLTNFLCSGSGAQESELGGEKSLKSSSENKDDAFSDEETPTRGKSAWGEDCFD